jgi:hypothetical protein
MCHFRGRRTPFMCLAQRQTTEFSSTKEDYTVSGIPLRSPLVRRASDKEKGLRYRVEIGMKISLIREVLMTGMGSYIESTR